MMAKVDRGRDEPAFSMDQWSGYEVARARILNFLHERRISNPVVLAGDIHSNWVTDLKLDFADPGSPTAGSEFVGTSISSGGDGADADPRAEGLYAKNPHLRFFNNQRGYVRCVVTPKQWQSDYRVVDYVTKPGSGIKTTASFVVEPGRPGPQRA